jgi:protein translocase SEC61 complex gamma subunit
MGKITSSIKRVLMVARRPTPEEFKNVLRISAIIVLLVGAVGFLFMIVGRLITGLA